MTTSFWCKKAPDAARSSSPDRPSDRRGFSLVEITIALGVFAFAILSIIGLLGVALDTSKDTQRDSSLATLVRTLNAEVRSATTTNAVNALLNGPLYYDFTGKPVAAGSNAHYTVTFSHSNQDSNKRIKVQTLLELQDASPLNIWSANIAYPSPANAHHSVMLLNNATY